VATVAESLPLSAVALLNVVLEDKPIFKMH
jgi:hypothetical protein